jgi:hypothetical protein
MKTLRVSLLLFTAYGLLGCANGPNAAVSLSFSGRSASVTAAPAAYSPPAGSSAADVLVITKAEMVLRKIELTSVEGDNCDVTPEPASCEEFVAGPIRLEIPTTAGAVAQVSIPIPVGTYPEVEFHIHKVSSADPAEAAFRAANPDLIGKSIVVTGTFNGNPFTFVTDLDVEQELHLVPNLVVTDATTKTNLTVRVNLGDWFKTSAGTLIDPSTANAGQPNQGLVTANIERSMQAFEDPIEQG